METSVILLIILGAISGVSHGDGLLPDSLIAAAGEAVIFTTTLTPPVQPFQFVTWSFTDSSGSGSGIITSTTTENTTNPEYADRITIFTSTGSLELSNVALTDTGEYTVLVIPHLEPQQKGNCRLEVYALVSNIKVNTNATDIFESSSSSVTLSCSSSGSFLSFRWLNGSSEVAASDRVQLTDGGSTLTIVSVTRHDQGPFRCQVFNPVSEGTSDPVNICIIYGPENINLTRSPSQEYYDEGSDISLVCSVVSGPAADFKWFLNGDELPHTEQTLRLTNIQKSHSGNYSCQAFNRRTMRNQTSQLETINVLTSEISNVVITPNATELSELSSSVSLSCSSSGSFPSFLWLNDSSEVTPSERVQLTDEGATLTIINVTRYDQGPFICHVFNNFSNSTSDPVKLSISYGPENTNLKLSPSQEYHEEGSNISLMCSADSRPAASFHWFLNGDELPHTEAELKLMNIQKSQSGNYSCQAFNDKTLRSQTSQASVISVQTAVSGVVVVSNNTYLLEFISSVSLFSSSSSGSSLSFLWLNGSSEVTASDRVQLTEGGSTLTIINVTRYDQGPFRCNMSNGISHEMSRPLNLFIHHGPDNVAIEGPAFVHVGDFAMLHCYAMSVPSAKLTWFFNGEPIATGQEAVHIIEASQSSDDGTYTCTAVNAALEQSQTVNHELTVTYFSNCDYSAAAVIAAILTAGCCLLIAALCGITVCAVGRRKRVSSNYAAYRQEKLSKKQNHQEVYMISGTT